MPVEIAAKRSSHFTRERILEAAILRFSQHCYEATKLRDIAADVGVDVALVHRSFGSKEALFTEAVNAALDGKLLSTIEARDLSAALAASIFEPRVDSALKLIDPIDIVAQSLSSPQANRILRKFVLRDFINPLTAKLADRTPHRAALAIACLTGFAILRDVLRIEPLLDGSKAELQPLLEKVLRICLDDDPRTERPEPAVA
jgi:AcrR family transcriptional regulator